MWNAKADGLHSSVFLDRLDLTSYEIEVARMRAHALRSQALAKNLRSMVDAVKGWFAMRRTRRQMLQLDDQMLEDIGLTRYEIYDAFETPSVNVSAVFAPVTKLVRKVVDFVKGWNGRRNAYQQLSILDDHMLEDIGIRRDEIEAIAFRGKVRKPLMHAPVSVESLRTQALPGVRPENGNKHIAA